MFLNRILTARPYLAGLLGALLITGCHDGDNAGNASSGPIAAPDASSSGTIVLQGFPPSSVVAGSSYSFVPTLLGTTSPVQFRVSGKPQWALFDTATGALTGTPTDKDQGTSGNITITASNQTNSASLTPFSISVKTADGNAISTTLSWNAPTENTDGTAITGLAGYHVYYGASPDELKQAITVPGAASTTCIVSGLKEGTYYFAVVAYNSTGTDSGQSSVVSQTI